MTTSSYDDIWKTMREYNFEMNDEINSDMMCTICKNVMINACFGLCGCRYCLGCIQNYLIEGKKFCPGGLKFCNTQMINVEDNINLDHSVDYRIVRTNVKCPMESCEYKDELRNMNDHLKTCKSQPANCPYFNIGCDKARYGVYKMKDHIQMDNYEHSKLLIEYVDNLKNEIELLKKEITELREENHHLKLDGKGKQENIVELLANAKVNSEQTELLNREFIALKEEINNLKETDRQNQVTIVEWQTISGQQSHQINHSKEKLNQMDQSIKNIEMKICEDQVNWGEFVWVIEGISGKIEQARNGISREIFSDPFYSHKDGYKMCLRADPNGIGNGYGSHLSAFFCVVHGPFDDTLSWPFEATVTMSVMNQQSGLVHVSMTTKCGFERNHPAYQKPTKERNNCRGHPRFVELDQLLSNVKLIMDDKLIIKCTVTIL